MDRHAGVSCRWLVLALAWALPAAAVKAPLPGIALHDWDVRTDGRARLVGALAQRQGAKPDAFVAGPAVFPDERQLVALLDLEQRAGVRIVARWDDVTGSPHFLHARAGALTAGDPRTAEEVARDFVLERRDLWRLTEAESKALRVRPKVPLSGGGAVVHFVQEIAGLPVLQGQVAIAVDGDGRVLSASGGGVTGVGAFEAIPSHTPSDALVALALAAGVQLAKIPEPTGFDGDSATFLVPELRQPQVAVRLVVAPTAFGPRLAWQAVVAPRGTPSTYEVVVDDAGLLPLRRSNRTKFADTRGRVFAESPSSSPHAVERFPDTRAFRSDLSPLGWADADLTAGNNCLVSDDIAADDDATPGRRAQAAPGPPFVAFDFPYSGNPANDLDAGMTNLFYWLNRAHDRFAALGFDEASGNFQQDNGRRGGVGGDPVIGDAQDGGGTNNANFATQPDGFPGRVQMYLWDLSGSPRDGSLEADIVVHEFGHGVSTRLVGGGTNASCLFAGQGSAMGEGWSDFFAGSFLDDTVLADFVSGSPDGIRMFHLDDLPATGRDYRNYCTFANDLAPYLCEPHDNGEIWSGFLWRIREGYVARYGAADGTERIERLVVDGLKLTPCTPSMLDARDALILADRAATGGENECLIKAAAAERWMGFDASSNGGGDAEPVAGNAPWPECQTTGVVRFTREGLEAGAPLPRYSCSDVVTISVTDGDATAPFFVTVTTSGGDFETVDMSPSLDPAVFLGSIQTDDREPVPVGGNGVLDVNAGDTITASYLDPPRLNPSLAQAEVDCVPRLRVVGHRLTASTCDDDTVAGFPQLPGFLDAGESADLEVRLRNLMPVPVDGALLVSTTRPDLLTVLPRSPLPLRLSRALGSAPSETVVTLRVAGADTIQAGDVADIELRLLAPGFDSTAPITLPLRLHHDYQLVAGLTVTDDIEGETAPPVGPAWTTANTQPAVGNEWTVETCSSTTPGGTRAYRNGPSDCTGNYGDAQGAPYLAMPALPLFQVDTAAVRLVNVSWNHDIDLGSQGIPQFGVPQLFDAEAVIAVATNDPDSLDTTQPLALFDLALAFYAHIEIPGVFVIDSNTNGWAPESIDVPPQQLPGLDLTAPVQLAWVFLTDVTPSEYMGFPFDAQAEGYYLDDVVVTYDRVDEVPQGTACTAGPTPFSVPRITEPVSGTACAGSVVTVDASASDAALCGQPPLLEFRFLSGGAVVGCFDDIQGSTPRVQDVDGWGASPVCHDFPAVDTTYDVEVRCANDPLPTDTRQAEVRVIDGRPAGSPFGTLLVGKTAGCPGPADVLLRWPDSGLLPQTFVMLRGDDPQLDPIVDRLLDADGLALTDANAACDGGGAPYRGVAVYFYSLLARDACSGNPLP